MRDTRTAHIRGWILYLEAGRIRIERQITSYLCVMLIAYLCQPQTAAESVPTSGLWCRTHWSGGQHLEQSRCSINIDIGQISKVPFNSTVECVILRGRGSFSFTHAFKTHSAAR